MILSAEGVKVLVFVYWDDLSGGVSHHTCLHSRVNSVDRLSWRCIGRTDTLCCGPFFPLFLLGQVLYSDSPWKLSSVMPWVFFYEFIFDEMISCAKAYKVQLGGDSLRGDCNVQKVLQRLDTNILNISCQNMWNNITTLKDDMSKDSITNRALEELSAPPGPC